MKFSMTVQEKCRPFNTGDCLSEETTWAGLTTYIWDIAESDDTQITLTLILFKGGEINAVNLNLFSR